MIGESRITRGITELDGRHYDAMGYALKVDPDVVKCIAETVWLVAQRSYHKKVIGIINAAAAVASTDTGHGKAQRAFANRVLRDIGTEP